MRKGGVTNNFKKVKKKNLVDKNHTEYDKAGRECRVELSLARKGKVEGESSCHPGGKSFLQERCMP